MLAGALGQLSLPVTPSVKRTEKDFVHRQILPKIVLEQLPMECKKKMSCVAWWSAVVGCI